VPACRQTLRAVADTIVAEMVTSHRAGNRMAAVPELANLVCMEFAAQDIEPPTPVVNNIVAALVDARRWLVARGSNADESSQTGEGREALLPLQPPLAQSSAGQSAEGSSFSAQVSKPELLLTFRWLILTEAQRRCRVYLH
jgi:hypothetical protein